MNPRPSSLGGASPHKASMHWSSTRSFQSTLTSLLSCASKGHRGEQVGVNPSSDRGEGEYLLVCMGLSGVVGGI